MTTMLRRTLEDTVKSLTEDNNKTNTLPEEWEILRIKQYIGIESSEIITYKTLIEVTQRTPGIDVDFIVPLVKHNLNEEVDMQNWCINSLPIVVDKLLLTIIYAVSK